MNSAGSPRTVLAEGELSAPYAPVEGSEGDRLTDRSTPKTADGSMYCLWLPLVLSVRGGGDGLTSLFLFSYHSLVEGRGSLYLTAIHCHHHNDFRIKTAKRCEPFYCVINCAG